MFVFKCEKEKFTIPDIGEYEAYSIIVIDDKSLKKLRYIPDVFTDSYKAHKFVELCNTYQPELVHLEDIIESFYNK